ncbi:MAG: CarD family transcriptional regulator [Pseudomonadota bacterium]
MATKTAEAKTKKATATGKSETTRRKATTKTTKRSSASTKSAAKSTTKAAASKSTAKKSSTSPVAKTATKKKSAAKATTGKSAKSAASSKTAAKKAVKAASPKTKAKTTKAATKTAPKTKTAAKTAPTKATAKKTTAKKTTTTKSAKNGASNADRIKQAAQKVAAKLQSSGAANDAPPKKLNVGQKPRSEKTEAQILPSNFAATQAANAVDAALEKDDAPAPEAAEAKQTYRVDDHIVYPAHGVGKIVAIEKQVIAGITNELFLIDFEQEKMRLRVPTAKATAVGMRRLSDGPTVDKALEILKGRARIKRTMWSRRAQEYEAKINSGDINSVAEVVRDLFRASDQPEQSYSERQLFEAAQDRLAREVAAVRKSTLEAAIGELEHALAQKLGI